MCAALNVYRSQECFGQERFGIKARQMGIELQNMKLCQQIRCNQADQEEVGMVLEPEDPEETLVQQQLCLPILSHGIA